MIWIDGYQIPHACSQQGVSRGSNGSTQVGGRGSQHSSICSITFKEQHKVNKTKIKSNSSPACLVIYFRAQRTQLFSCDWNRMWLCTEWQPPESTSDVLQVLRCEMENRIVKRHSSRWVKRFNVCIGRQTNQGFVHFVPIPSETWSNKSRL